MKQFIILHPIDGDCYDHHIIPEEITINVNEIRYFYPLYRIDPSNGTTVNTKAPYPFDEFSVKETVSKIRDLIADR